MSRPGRLLAIYLKPLFDRLRTQGVGVDTLLHNLGFDPESLHRPETHFSVAQLSAIVASLTRQTGRTDLAFDTGMAVEPASLGALGQAIMNCRDFDHVYQLTSRYSHLITDLYTMRYQRHGLRGDGAVNITPLTSMSPMLLHFLIEAVATSAYQQIHFLLGTPRRPFDLHIAIPAPPHLERYGELRLARARFVEGTLPGVTMFLPAELLDAPLRTSAPHVVAEIEAQLQSQMRRVPAGTRWGDYVASLLREALGPMPSIEELAHRLGITVRTIDRHLAAEGLSFREMAHAVRIARARELLSQPGATVSKVAEQLGFGDPASFSRAFRRSAGMPPGAYQRSRRPAVDDDDSGSEGAP